MCNNAKLALANWWILTFIAVMLWYRNISYDRVMAAFIFVLGLVQLIEYGIYNSMNEDQGARILFIVLWLQCLVLAVGVYLSQRTLASTLLLWVFIVIFAIVVIYAMFSSDDTFFGGDLRSWFTSKSSLLGDFGWLYMIGIVIPFIILLSYADWNNIGLWILTIYLIIIFVVISIVSPSILFPCYAAIGFAFLVWLLGMFNEARIATF